MKIETLWSWIIVFWLGIFFHYSYNAVPISTPSDDEALYGTSNPAVRKAMAEYYASHPDCECCGAKSNIETGTKCNVHHIKPQHLFPEFAADLGNFITLCRHCHWWLGHCRNWQHWNEVVTGTVVFVREAYSNSAEEKQ